MWYSPLNPDSPSYERTSPSFRGSTFYNVDPPRYNLSCNRFNISYKYGQLML